MGLSAVCVTITCAAFVLVIATGVPQTRDPACRPCPNPCECTLIDGQTCSVNCSARGLTTFPRQLPNDRRRKLILDLSSNALKDLRMHNIAHLQHLKSISLSSNSWHCHCTIFWSSRWLLGRTKEGLHIQNINKTKCEEPSHLKGITLANIGSRADLCHTPLNFISCLKMEDDRSFRQIEYFVRSSGLHDALDCDQFCFDQDFLVSSFSNSDQTCSCGRPSVPGLPCSYNATLASEPLEGQLVRGKIYLRNSRLVLSHIQFQVQNMTVSSANVASVSVRLTVVPSHCFWSFGRNEGRLMKYGKSCESADYRYIWPGHYNLTAELASVNDSVRVIGNTVVRIQDPVIVSILPYSAEVKSDQPLPLSISIISGTDVSVYWNITNDSGKEEHGAADFLFDVPKYITGASNFIAFIDVVVSVSESTSLTSKPNGTTVFLFPGWSFSRSGTLLKWMFRGNFSVARQTWAFQIYRPSCSNTTYNLLPPGSEAEFSVCSKSRNFTKPESNCSDGMQYCPLSMNCLPKQSPCTCDESAGNLSNACKWAEMDILTSEESSQFNSDHQMPNYILVGDWTVDLMLEMEAGYELIVNGFEVQKYDVVGLQFSSEIPPINCIQDDKSPWRQHVLSMHQDSWITRYSDISTSEGIWSHSMVCDVMVTYSTPQMFKLLSSVSLPSGLNTISVHFSNLVSHQTESIALKAVPEIKQLSLLYPDRTSIWPPLTNTSGTLLLEANTVRTFVFAVNAGSNAYLVNSFDSLVTVFDPNCPPDFPVDLHCSESYLHAVKKAIFPASANQSGSQVLFEAVNGVSLSYLMFDILSVVQIRNVCLTNNVSQVWPLYSNAVGFRVTLSSGNLILYEWTTSDEYLSVSRIPEMQHAFSHPGNHSVSVNVSNALSFQVTTLHLTLYQLSDVNISHLELPDVVATGTVVGGSVVLRMKPYGVVACMFYVNSVLVKNVTVVSSENWTGPDASYKNVGFFFNASYAGVHDVLVVAMDLLLYTELQSNASVVVVSRAVDAEDVITGLLLDFNVSADDRYQYHFAVSMVTGSNVTFSFAIDQSIFINTSEALVTHTFTSAGMHQISVVAFNRISRGKKNMLMYIESSVDDSATAHDDDDDDRGPGDDDVGLELVGCCQEIFATHTNVSLAVMANKGSLISFSCSWWIVHQETVVAYFQGYNVTFTVRLPGVYSIMVRANNYRKSHILTDTFVVQEPISSVYIYTNAGHEGIIVHQELFCTAMHATGSNPVYFWSITTQSGKFDIKEIKENRMTAVFLVSGTYEVYVFVKNSVSNASALNIIRALVCSPPVLQLVGSAMRQELRSQRVTVEVVVQSCVIHEALHKWLIYRGNCTAKVDRITLPHSITSDTPTLHLPPRTLVYGTYCLHFSSEYVGVKMTNRSEVFVNLSIIASPLKAIIYGGDERALTVDEKIILDGTYSYDPDVEEGDPSQITYSWSCQANHSGLQTECFPPSNKSIYELLPNTFNENQTYAISLSIGSQKPTSLKYKAPSTTIQKIHGKSADVPQVTINCVSCRDTNLFAITHSQIIKLVGSCGSQSCETNDEYRWVVIRNDSRSLTLNSETTTTGGNKKNLVIREFVLNCSHSYTFTLYVTSFANVVGFASIVLQPANAPRNGTCRAIIPKSGVVVALVNAVLVTCTGWTDGSSSASQLEYNIYVNETRAVNPRWYPIYRGPRGNVTFYLSTFHNLTEHVQLNVEVIDLQRSLTNALTKLINVTSPPSRMEFLATLIYEELEEEINHNDPRQIVPRIIAILLQLNSESRMGNSSQAARQIREDMRSRLLIYLNETITIGAIQDIQQIAFAMKLVTDIPREFPKLPLHFELVLQTLQEILIFITPYLSQGLQGDEFVPSYLLDTASNFIDAMFFLDSNGENVFDSENRLHRQAVQMATDIIDEIMILLFQTKVAEEEPVGFYATSISSWGQRVSADNIQPMYTGPGAVVSFPQTLASVYEKVELFQYVTTYGYNPFQWGYAESSPISTRVVTVALFDTFGNLMDTPQLPDNDEIEISVKNARYIPHERDDVYSITIDQYELLALNSSAEATSRSVRQVKNVSEAPLPSDSDTVIKVSLLPLESSSTRVTLSPLNVTSLGLKVRAFANASAAAADVSSLENVTVQMYFGEEYIPHKYKADHSLHLVLHHQVINGSGLYGQLFKFITLDSSALGGMRKNFYLTFVNEGVTASVDIELLFYEISCKLFNESSGLWNETGCRPVNATSTWTTCRCSQMATFGASSIPVHAVTESVLLSGAEFSGNPIVIATVLIALTVYIVGQVLMLYWDRLNMMMLATLPLCGKDGPFRYEVVVFTGKAFGSGTTSNVGIKIFGLNHQSGRVHLFRPGSFRRNAQDKFIVATCSFLGPICKLKIWHDNTGSHPSWNLARISVRDLQTDHVYHFLADCSLSLDPSVGRIEKTLSVTDESVLSTFFKKFKLDLFYRLSEQHLWLSLFDCCPWRLFGHSLRMTCCCLSTFSILSICTIFYGLVEEQTEYEDLMGTSAFRMYDSVLVFVSSACSLLTSSLMLEIFRHCKQKPALLPDRSRRSSKSVTIEMDDMTGRPNLSHYSSSVGDKMMNVLNPSELFELDIDNMSDASSFQTPVASKQLHRTAVMSTSNSETIKTQTDVKKKQSIEKLLPKKHGDAHLWSCDMILHSWPGEISSQRDVNDSISLSGSLSTSAEDVCSRDLKLTVGDKVQASRDVTLLSCDVSEKKCTSKGRDCIRTTPNQGPHYDSGVVLSDNIDCSSADNISVYTIPFHGANDRPTYVDIANVSQCCRSTCKNTVKEESISLPYWVSNVTWLMCIILLCGSCVLILVIGHQFNTDLSLRWLTVSLLAIVFSVIVFDTLKVLIISLVVAIKVKTINLDDYQVHEKLQIGSNEQFRNVKIKPLGGFALQKAKKNAENFHTVQMLFRHLIIYSVFLVVVFAICYAPNRGETAYFYSKSIDDIMAENMSNASNGRSLDNMHSASDYWKWLESVFIGQLYSNSSGWNESTNNHHLLGKSRLRQQRSTQVPCLIEEKYGDSIWKNTSYSCHSNPGWQEDTSSYSPGWIPLSPDSSDNDTWKHMSASGLSSVSYWGSMGWYSGGGYDQLLSPHYNEAIKTMNQLRSNNWINEGTRVVLLEFTIYNGDIDLFASVLVAVEFGLTGDIYASQSIFIFHPLIFPSSTVTLLIILEAVLAGFTIYFICTIIHSAWKSTSQFFANLWSYWDILITCLSSLSVILFVIIVTNDTDSYQRLVTSHSVDDFVDFRRLGVLHYMWIYVNAILLTFVLILVVKQLRYVKFLAAFFLTLRISCCVIFCCAFIFVLILVTYSLAGNLWFGRELSQFLTVGSSFVTLVGLLRGKSMTLAEMAENHLCFSLVFLVTFLCFVLFAVYNLIISEFGKTFHKTRKQINYYNAVKPHDYEIVSFMTKQLKKHFKRDGRSKGAFRNVRFQDCSTVSSVVSAPSLISEDLMDEAEELSSSDASQSPAEDGSSSFSSFDASSAGAEDIITPELAVSSCDQILERLDRIVRLDDLNSALIDKLQRVVKRSNCSSPAGTSQRGTRQTVDCRIRGVDVQTNRPPIHLQKAESPLSKKLFTISSDESWV